MNDIIKNLLVNTAKKSMLESIDGIDDIDFLKKELKEHLRSEFNLQQRINRAIEYIKEYKFATTHFNLHSDRLLSILKGEDKE